MSSLNSLYIKKEALETLLKGVNAKGLKGIELTLSINDEGNQYDQNISAYVAQTKEEREAKKPKFYVGNGKTFYTDGKIQVPTKKQEPTVTDATVINNNPFADDEDDLPW